MATSLEFLLIRHVNKASDDADFVTTMTLIPTPGWFQFRSLKMMTMVTMMMI